MADFGVSSNSVRLFDRRCSVLVGKPEGINDYKLKPPGALKIEGLRITFKIEKDNKPEPNRSEVQIFNLSGESRSKIEEKGVRVVISAGYADSEAVIFSGDARTVSHIQTGVDWSTKFGLGDAERAIKYARVSQSFQAGCTLVDLVKSCVDQLGVDAGNSIDRVRKLGNVTFNKGASLHAPAFEELKRLLTPRGLSVSVQNGRLVVLGKNEHVPELGPLISPDTGLIGSPAMGTPEAKGKPAYLKLKSLLQPALQPNMRFKLDSSLKKGEFLVHKLTHEGDTFGGPWYTDLEATPVT